MRILENWQYKYIEKSLFNYNSLINSNLETEQKMVKAINETIKFFKGTIHETMINEYYIKRDIYKKKYSSSGHYRHVCTNLIHLEESSGYVVRREIIYKTAMHCYSLGIFKIS